MAHDQDERRPDEVADDSPREFLVNEQPEGVLPGHGRSSEGPGARVDRGPGDREQNAGRATEGGSVSVMGMIVTGALALVFGVIGASAYSAFLGGTPGSGQVAEGGGPEAAVPGDAPADPADSLADDRAGDREGGDSDASDDRINRLAEEVVRLRDEMRAMAAPDSDERIGEFEKRLAEVDNRLATLETIPKDVAGLADDLKQRSDRLDEMSDMLDQVESQVTTLSDLASATTEETTADAGSGRSESQRRALRPNPDDGGEAETALERGIRQFQADDFQAARETFQGLLERNPSDARAWYYAALASGKATGDWKGETERLVLQGVEREREGTPPGEAIDSAFDDLTERQGGEWLRFYRRRAGE